MAQDQVTPAVGDDVTALMMRSGVPPIGADVTHLMVSERPSDSGALSMAAAAKAFPLVTRAAEQVAISPSVPKVIAKVGRVIGGATPAIGGVASGNPLAAVNGVLGASQGAWAGGRAGWFTGKLAQRMTAPVASALKAVEPYLQTVTTLSGAQGALDLAQMAEPKREDIGFLGLSATKRTQAERDAHPALLNLLAMKASDAISALKETGISADDAASAYRTLKAHLFKGLF